MKFQRIFSYLPELLNSLAPARCCWYGLLLLTLLSGFGCQQQESAKGSISASEKLSIVTTTGILADAVRNITGEKAAVAAIMGPGVDPHLYKATQGDLGKLQQADMVIYNGLHLEGKMGEVLEKLAKLKTVVSAAENLPQNQLRKDPEFQNAVDPHIWFNVALWKQGVEQLSKAIQEKDPTNAEAYKQQTQQYTQQLDSLHQWVQQQIASIPEQQRILITAHDAFGYFGDAYNIQVRGLQGISTITEFGLRDVSSLVDFIVQHKIKAVFVESSVSAKAIEAVVEGCRNRGHEVKIGGTLYSDALGEAGTPAGTYIGMIKANVNTIVSALK